MKRTHGPRPVGYVALPGRRRDNTSPRQQQPHLRWGKFLRVLPDGAHLMSGRWISRRDPPKVV